MGQLTTQFLWRMEHILDVYNLPYDPQHPKICVDERPCQLLEDVLVPLPMETGKPKREGYQYKRNGVCTVFMAFEPLTGFRMVEVCKQRTKKDYARFMQKVAQHPRYAAADQIGVVQDNLNTHDPGSFYALLPPDQAFALGQRFDMIFTPKKASWLNMVEIEFSALARQCLNRRIGQVEVLEQEVKTWVDMRNQKQVKVHWQFTIDKAREKFTRHYPELT